MVLKDRFLFKIPKWNLKKSNSFTVVEDSNESKEIENNTIKRSVSFKVPKWKETKEVQSIVPRTNSFWPKSTRQRLFLPYFAIPCHQHSNELQIQFWEKDDLVQFLRQNLVKKLLLIQVMELE